VTVMPVSGYWIRDSGQFSIKRTCHLDVNASLLMLPRPQLRVILPWPAGKQGPVNEVLLVWIYIFRGWNKFARGPRDQRGYHLDSTAYR
jgi:hypothetical protein